MQCWAHKTRQLSERWKQRHRAGRAGPGSPTSCPYSLRRAGSPAGRCLCSGYGGCREHPEVSYLGAWLASGHEEEVGMPRTQRLLNRWPSPWWRLMISLGHQYWSQVQFEGQETGLCPGSWGRSRKHWAGPHLPLLVASYLGWPQPCLLLAPFPLTSCLVYSPR